MIKQSPRYKDAEPCMLTKEAISQLAGKVAAKVGYVPCMALNSLATRLGGKLEYVDFWELDNTDSGSIVVEPNRSFTIYLPNHTSNTRDRFTVAHEIGHFVLHFLLPRAAENLDLNEFGLTAARFGTGPREIEANQFAAAFLMPEDEFKNTFINSGNDAVETADYFNVSVSTVRIRAKSLGIG